MSASSTMVPSHSQVSVPPIVTLMKTIESLRPVTDDEFVPKDAQELLDILPKVYDAITNYMLCFPESYVDFWNILKPVVKHVKQHSTTHSTPNLPPPNLKNFPKPPEAPAKRITFTNFHGEEWHDDYKWLHDREDPAVLEYIQKENEYTTTCLAPTAPLQKLLYKEFISRIDENEQSAHVTLPDGYSYYSRKVQGEEYRQHCRINVETGVEEVYLDENEIAALPEFAEATFFRVGFLRHSPCGRFIAFGIDDSGNERYKVFFKDLRKMECFDRLESVWEDFEFSNDGNYVYYLLLDDYERAYKIMRHKVGSGDQTSDVELYEEVDEMFYLTLTKSCNSRYVFFNASAQITSETRYIDLEEEAETEVETIDEATGEKVKKTNITLAELPTPFELLSIRETVIPPRDFVLIEDFQIRVRHLVVFERSNCIQNVRIVDLTDPSLESYHYISFSESVYSLWPMSVNEEVADLSKQTLFNTNILRYTYTSLIQPKQIVDYNMDTREFSVVHTERVVGPIPYTPELYASRRLFATGEDGTAVPISIVYRKDLLGLGENKPNPLLLHGYGAYAHCVNPIFSTQRLSLLDRGFIYAVAHVRGGADMGMGWYEEGKLGKKVNTFNDFIRCMEYLIKEGYTSPSQLAIYGRSAGGLLIGAVYNMRPDLFCSALTEVPFVDVVNTMFDSSIPWTAFEYEEWGNPEDKNIYEAMKGYCPYTNIKEINYPHLMVVGGMNDPRVAFFEPLKFVAKLRKFKHGDNLLLLRVDDAGHGGNSGLYSYLEVKSLAFLIGICAED
ncbi:prolyl oligopeptidase family-domain-containing protein [Paraphysoderma sedebokerense]|nr:prolyl oligopeptidase family-domain-containing protein [Paraphysoderma sedebokerense]